MSSYAGASAPGTGYVVLAKGVTVNLATTDAQALCTPSQGGFVTHCIVRNGVTAGTSATAAFTVGYTAALASIIGTATMTSMPSTTTTTGTFIATPVSRSTAQVPGTFTAGQTLYFSMAVVSSAATSASVDLLGYLL